MKPLRVEDRLLMVEKELAALQEIVSKNVRVKDWRRTVGMFTGDEAMKRIDEAALKFREADRLKVRRLARSKRTKR